jgi:hypothetical protein
MPVPGDLALLGDPKILPSMKIRSCATQNKSSTLEE